MATYYFDPDAGSDGATGLDSDHPKQNPSSVSFAAYDVCLIKRGTIWTAPSGTSALSLNAGGIRVGPYGLGNVPKIVGTNVSRGITVNNVAGCTVEDIWLADITGLTATRYGVIVTTTGGSETVTSSTTLRRVKVTNVAHNNATGCNGIMAWGHGNTIDSCEVDTVGTDCFWLKCRNLSFLDNLALNPAQDDDVVTPGGDCFQFPGGGFDYSNLLFRGNIGHHETTNNNKNCLIILDCTGTNIVFEENEFYAAVAANQINAYIDVAGAIVRNNLIVGGDYALYLANAGGNQSYGNRISGANYGVRLASIARGQKLYHNVIRGNNTGFYGSADDATTELKNNIVASNTTGLALHGNMVEDYNSFYGNTTNRTLLGGSGSMGAHSITSDPLLSETDYPAYNSPCLSAGTDVGVESGADGRAYKPTPAIGAYEWYKGGYWGAYFGSRYFGRSYFGGPAGPIFAATAGMFGRYLGPSYFGRAYWGTPAIVEAGTFIDTHLGAAIEVTHEDAQTIGAAVLWTPTATAWMGAQVMFPMSATASLDALLNAQNYAYPIADAAIRYERTAGASMGSYILRSDYYLNLAWNAVAGATGYFVYFDTTSHAGQDFSAWPAPIDVGNVTAYRLGNLVEGLTYYVAVAAHDANLYPGKLATQVSGIPLSPGTTFTTSTSFDAALRVARSATVSAGAAVVAQRATVPLLEAAVQWARSATPSLDSAIRLTPTASASMDGAIVRQPDRSPFIDAAIEYAREASASISAMVQAGTEYALSMSAAIEAEYNIASDIDGVIQLPLDASASMDAVLFAPCTVAADMDAAIATDRGFIPLMDAFIATGPSVTTSMSAYVSAQRRSSWWHIWHVKHKKRTHFILD